MKTIYRALALALVSYGLARGQSVSPAEGSGGSGGTGCIPTGATLHVTVSDGSGGCTISNITTDAGKNNLLLPGGITTGVGGGVAGYDFLGQGTATAAGTGQVGWLAPVSVTTPFAMKLPAAPITGFLLNTGTSDPSTITFVPVIAVANGGTNCSSPTITCFNNITGFTAAGATGTTSGNLVFSISPALTGTPTTPTPSQNDNSTKIPTTAYVDLAVANGLAGVNPAVAVLAASTANLTGTYANGVSGVGATFTVTATGTFSLDGVAINTIGQRVLLKDQSTGFQNGVYTATVVGAIAVSPVFTRALDYNSPSDINSTGAIPVQSGTVNTTTSWLLTSTVTTIGTDALTYVRFSSNPANLVSAISPGAGVAHFAGGTQTVTSSTVVNADIANSTIDLAAKVTGVLPTANIAVALANQTSLRSNAMAAAAGDATIGQVIAHGAKALDFASTATGACATVITDTATGTLSTDVIIFTTNASIKAVTGYVPAATGGFSINAFPSADTVSFEGCNWTSGTVDPGSITVNWKVIR